jgi:hypothetical protein
MYIQLQQKVRVVRVCSARDLKIAKATFPTGGQTSDEETNNNAQRDQ